MVTISKGVLDEERSVKPVEWLQRGGAYKKMAFLRDRDIEIQRLTKTYPQYR